MRIRRVLLLSCAAVTTLFSAFFCYYTVRLAWMNLFVSGVAAHRSAGMLIGAIAFPTATLFFGWIAWRCSTAASKKI